MCRVFGAERFKNMFSFNLNSINTTPSLRLFFSLQSALLSIIIADTVTCCKFLPTKVTLPSRNPPLDLFNEVFFGFYSPSTEEKKKNERKGLEDYSISFLSICIDFEVIKGLIGCVRGD